jgi:creatinine amidohydrolase/Fe(II)-dependent formamide hydrolase-like protein
MHINPRLVRPERFAPNGVSRDSGVSGDPTKASAALGKELLELKITNALAQIRAGLAGGSR